MSYGERVVEWERRGCGLGVGGKCGRNFKREPSVYRVLWSFAPCGYIRGWHSVKSYQTIHVDAITCSVRIVWEGGVTLFGLFCFFPFLFSYFCQKRSLITMYSTGDWRSRVPFVFKLHVKHYFRKVVVAIFHIHRVFYIYQYIERFN